jgi:hypothetical protein
LGRSATAKITLKGHTVAHLVEALRYKPDLIPDGVIENFY